ncbi:uncharacterized protein LAJ45_04079 [Morchella importuna]|uniref:uncharacterized protein n=1 Tax=Morchella importuna TaxID=1174673 RepID=UPI001E8E7E9A|nr:uncharacterized protein LAJ45_04079 [Morchella importuna]KAH8152085.1 hypothetical protein LAJ45_04079 [Morchella importuna]
MRNLRRGVKVGGLCDLNTSLQNKPFIKHPAYGPKPINDLLNKPALGAGKNPAGRKLDYSMIPSMGNVQYLCYVPAPYTQRGGRVFATGSGGRRA